MTADIITQVAFITGRILHAGTGQPVVGRIRITAEEGPIIDKVLEDGTFAISGWLELLFPNLDTQDYQLHLHVHVDSPQFRQGFIELALPPVTIAMGSNFDPDPPTPPDPLIDLGTILLPADTVNIQGRVVESENPDTPIASATVEVLQSGTVTHTATTDSEGLYRFDEKNVVAPAEIQCSKTGFKTQKRTLLLDFGKLMNEEYFRLPPQP